MLFSCGVCFCVGDEQAKENWIFGEHTGMPSIPQIKCFLLKGETESGVFRGKMGMRIMCFTIELGKVREG